MLSGKNLRNNEMKQKLFTKSVFKIALECPKRLFYAYDSNLYANQGLDDDFLKSLAEGGFQVGELAKVYYGIHGDAAEQGMLEWMEGMTFESFVSKMSSLYCNRVKARDFRLGSKCFSCPFHKVPSDEPAKLDGYVECWKEKARFTDADFSRPLLKDLSGQYIRKGKMVDEEKYFMEELLSPSYLRSENKRYD